MAAEAAQVVVLDQGGEECFQAVPKDQAHSDHQVLQDHLQLQDHLHPLKEVTTDSNKMQPVL